ncbi:hypothetical protein D3C75_667910 [compost metagenome]
MRHRDELVEVLFADRIKCINSAVKRPDVRQIIADIVIQPFQPGQTLQLLGIGQQTVQNAPQSHCIIYRTVMALQQDFIFVGERVQPVVLHARVQQARKLQRIE